MQPILLIESRAPGLLYVNGQFCGELTQPQPFPARPDARALIELRPLGMEALPMACALTLRAGRVQPHGQEGVYCVQWPDGVAQVELRPPSWPGRMQAVRTTLLQGLEAVACGGETALLRDGEPVTSLPGGAREIVARALDGGALAVQGACDAGAFACVVPQPDGRIAEGATALLTARSLRWEGANVLRAVVGSEDAVGHGELREYRVGPDGFRLVSAQPVWTQGMPRWPQSAQETLRAYLEAVRLGLRAEAEGYLAAPHAAPALARFDGVTPLRYPLLRVPERLPLAMGLLSVAEPGLAYVTAVCARARAANGRQGGYALEEVALYEEA